MGEFYCTQCNGPVNVLCKITIPTLKVGSTKYTELVTVQCMVCQHVTEIERTWEQCQLTKLSDSEK